MKRIQCACLEQTIRFSLKDELPGEEALRYVKAEVEQYKHRMQAARTKHRIVEEIEQSDGTILLKIKKQYNTYPCGTYLAE